MKVEASEEEKNSELVCFHCHEKGHKKWQSRKWKKEKGKKKKEAQKQDSDSDSDADRITSTVGEMMIVIAAENEGNKSRSCSTDEKITVVSDDATINHVNGMR